MNRTLKTCLLWLLIAVMPFQAFAANVLRTCNSGHQGMTMVAATSMDHGDASASSHDAVMDQPQGDGKECPGMATSDEQSNDSPKSLKHVSCSACAACFVCAVAPPQLLTFKPSFNSAEVYVTFGPTLVAGFIPDSLERPPRLLAA